jgi:hypothetical protein
LIETEHKNSIFGAHGNRKACEWDEIKNNKFSGAELFVRN